MSEQPDLLGQMLGHVIRGDAIGAVATARRVLPDLDETSDAGLAWRSVLVLGEWRMLRDETAQQEIVAGRAASTRAGSSGWEAVFVALHAAMRSSADQGSRALGDLVDAEILLTGCDDPGLRRWAQLLIGFGYLQERLYELALPPLLAAEEITDQPIPLRISRLVELYTLARLHVRWAAELERAVNVDGEVDGEAAVGQVCEALRWLDLADETAEPEDSWSASLERLRAQALSFIQPEQAVGVLERHRMMQLVRGRRESAAEDAAHLSRALRLLGRFRRAATVAREAVDLVDDRTSTGTRMLAHHQLRAAQAAIGVPLAHGVDDYLALCSRLLWEQRLRSVETVRARRNFASLQRIHVETTRISREDPLTGIANRRGLEEWLERHPYGPAAIVMVDVDDFKTVNDEYGHGVGDLVLQLVAQCLETDSRAEDLVVRFGGDEFVILLAGDVVNAHELGRRIRRQIMALDRDGLPAGVVVSASVGAADVSAGEQTSLLVERADRYLLAMKRARIPAQGGRRAGAAVSMDA